MAKTIQFQKHSRDPRAEKNAQALLGQLGAQLPAMEDWSVEYHKFDDGTRRLMFSGQIAEPDAEREAEEDANEEDTETE